MEPNLRALRADLTTSLDVQILRLFKVERANFRALRWHNKTGWTVLKFGISSTFGPNFPMKFGTWNFLNFGRPSVHLEWNKKA